MFNGLNEADDFYVQVCAQVKLDSWSKRRTGVAGDADAAFYPSPSSGMGTSVVLAGETSKYGDDYRKAFEAYESIIRSLTLNCRTYCRGLWGPRPGDGLEHKRGEWDTGGL